MSHSQHLSCCFVFKFENLQKSSKIHKIIFICFSAQPKFLNRANYNTRFLFYDLWRKWSIHKFCSRIENESKIKVKKKYFKVPVIPDAITLGDFKRCINKPNYKFFFQSYDEDFGQVKEEITHDSQNLPKTQEGKIVCFLTPSDVKQVIKLNQTNTIAYYLLKFNYVNYVFRRKNPVRHHLNESIQ